MSLTQQIRVLNLIARTSGKKALYAAMPLYFVVGIVVFILFAGNGMDASYVTSLALGSTEVRASLLVGWAMLTLPVARLLVADPQTFFLRTLPVPHWWTLGIIGGALALVQLAWVVLWVRGTGVLSAAIALFAVLGGQSYAIAGMRSAGEWAALGCVAVGWYLAPSPASLALLVPAFLAGHRLAWLRAPEPKASGQHRVLTRTAGLAAATAFGISAYRSNGSAAVRALALAALAFTATSLGLRNNPEWSTQNLTLLASAIWGAACLLGAVTLARPILRAESELVWVMDVCGVSSALRALSSIGLVAALGAVCGAAFGVALAPSTPSSWSADLALILHLSLGGAAWAALAMALVRITTRGTGRDSGRQLLALLSLYVAAALVLLASPISMLLFLVVAATLAAAYATRFATPVGAAFRQGT